jgi:hypothetical protein
MLAAAREPAAGAAALAFDPPIRNDGPRLELARAPREAAAVVGYEEGTAEYFSVRWDDRQSSGYGYGRAGGGGRQDRYERRAISERVGVLYR